MKPSIGDILVATMAAAFGELIKKKEKHVISDDPELTRLFKDIAKHLDMDEFVLTPVGKNGDCYFLYMSENGWKYIKTAFEEADALVVINPDFQRQFDDHDMATQSQVVGELRDMVDKASDSDRYLETARHRNIENTLNRRQNQRNKQQQTKPWDDELYDKLTSHLERQNTQILRLQRVIRDHETRLHDLHCPQCKDGFVYTAISTAEKSAQMLDNLLNGETSRLFALERRTAELEHLLKVGTRIADLPNHITPTKPPSDERAAPNGPLMHDLTTAAPSVASATWAGAPVMHELTVTDSPLPEPTQFVDQLFGAGDGAGARHGLMPHEAEPGAADPSSAAEAPAGAPADGAEEAAEAEAEDDAAEGEADSGEFPL